MHFKIGTILGAEYNAAHYNHIHVEPPVKFYGEPPASVSGMTPGTQAIYDALEEEFGPGAYFLDADADKAAWTHMGWYNRRYIGTGTTWSQHSWANALDIGPYYGVAGQKKFYDFLTGKEPHNMPEDVGQKVGVDDIFAAVWAEMIEEGVFSEHTDPDDEPRNEQLAAFLSRYTHRVVLDEIQRVFRQLQTGAADLAGKTLTVEVKEVK